VALGLAPVGCTARAQGGATFAAPRRCTSATPASLFTAEVELPATLLRLNVHPMPKAKSLKAGKERATLAQTAKVRQFRFGNGEVADIGKTTLYGN